MIESLNQVNNPRYKESIPLLRRKLQKCFPKMQSDEIPKKVNEHLYPISRS